MGAPELPNDPGDDDFHSMQVLNHPPSPSDDSDIESVRDGSDYEGYQPLALDDHNTDFGRTNADSNIMQVNMDFDENLTSVIHSTNIVQIETADVEIERNVWNQPRPLDLQIELDGNKTQQILRVMANFQLPNLTVPDWAAGVPEERWKEELLQRIRQRKPLGVNTPEADK